MNEWGSETQAELIGQLEACLQQGQWQQAEALCEQARARAAVASPRLDLLLARSHLRQGRPQQALGLLVPLREVWPVTADEYVGTHMGLAHAWRQLANLEAEREVLQSLLASRPHEFVAALQLGQLRQREGDQEGALHGYFAAVSQAQRKGRWLDDATTAPILRADVQAAMDYLDQGRHDLFMAVLQPLRARYGRQALSRVEAGLRIYLGLQAPDYADPRQQPTFFYLPGLPATPYPDRRLFPWLEQLEQATDAIREEMLATRQQASYQPFLGAAAEDLPPGLLAGSRGTPAWDAYFLYRHGQSLAGHHAACPATVAALARTPLVHIRDHAPEICFSVLDPGTHILPHRGVTNTRLTVHLPLQVPADCALRAGGEIHHWQQGRAMVFDDTFEHEAWNRSEQTRVILLMDTWHPQLEPVEREAMAGLVAAIGDFARASGTHDPG